LFASELRGERFHLMASLFERSRTIDFFGSQPQFLPDRHLGGNPAASFRFAKTARRESLELLRRFAPSDDEAIEFFVNAGFHEKRSFDKCSVARALAGPFVELAQDGLGDSRMDDGVQAVEFRAIGKNERSQLGAVHALLAIGDARTEFAENLVVSGLAGLDELVRERISVENRETHIAQHGSNGALAAGDSAGESESQHFFHRAVAVDGAEEKS
jgi:hypothetical protein